ncbi:MAG: DJ-1/PfpI family protein [Candidatus Margulisiibacteriota bacterium]|jgi:protease I
MKRIAALSLCFCALLIAGPVSAMGGPAPKDDYKLEILKVELVSGEATAEAGSSVEGKKVLLVVAPSKFDDKEFAAVKKTFEEAGLLVSVASTTKTAYGVFGAKVNCGLLKNAKAADYDALIFIGGPGVTVYNHSETATGLIAKAVKEDKVIGGLSLAPIALVNGGALGKGKKAAVSLYGKRALKGVGVNVTGRAVETDGKVVTGSGAEAAEEFAQAVITALQE